MSNCTFQHDLKKMSDKYSDKIIKYFNDCVEKKNDLVGNINVIEDNIRLNVDMIDKTSIPMSEKELLFIYSTKWLSFLGDLNHSILKFMESEVLNLPSIANYLQSLQEHRLKYDKSDANKYDHIKPEKLEVESSIAKSISISNLATDFLKFQDRLERTQRKICSKHLPTSTMLNGEHNQHYEYTPDKKETNSERIQDQNQHVGSCNSSNCTDYQAMHEPKAVLPQFKQHIAVPTVEKQQTNVDKDESAHDSNIAFHNQSVNNTTIENDWAKTAADSGTDVPKLQISHVSLDKMKEPISSKSQYSLVPNPKNNGCTVISSKNGMPSDSNLEPRLLEKNVKALNNTVGSHDKVNNWLIKSSNDREAISTLSKQKTIRRRTDHQSNKDRQSGSESKMKQYECDLTTKLDPGRDASNKSNKSATTYKVAKSPTIEKGSICAFSHVVSPSEFYLHIVNEANTKYQDEIEEYLNITNVLNYNEAAKFNSKEDAFTKLGNFCYGFIPKKKKWFRVEVLDWNLDAITNEVQVQAIDFGYHEMIPYTCLEQISEQYKHIPALAIKCHFPMLYPPGTGYCNNPEWPEEISQSLYDIVNKSMKDGKIQPKLFEVTMSYVKCDSVAVDMTFYEEEISTTLRNILIDFQLAIEITCNDSDYAEIEEFLQDVDALEDPDNLNEFIVGYNAQDEQRVCRFTDKNGKCFKGSNCKAEHVVLRDGYTTDKLETYCGNNLLVNDSFLTEGNVVQVFITAYTDLCTYWAQVIQKPCKNDGMIMDEGIVDLMSRLHDPKIISTYKKFKVAPALGELVLIRDADMWLRAIICKPKIDTNGDGLFKVQSVDFGYERNVKLNDIRVIPEQFINIPKQAIQIRLYNYRHNKTCDKKKIKKYFGDNIRYKNFMAHIKSTDPHILARITTINNAIDIGTYLLKDGFVVEDNLQLENKHYQHNNNKFYPA